jgi:hypothetical protein
MNQYFRTIALLLVMCLLVVGVVWFFTSSVNNLSDEQLLEDKQQLEQALARACVACYAVEGAYPPSLEHLQKYYGVQINTDLFTVKYEVFASNLMPDITVLVN